MITITLNKEKKKIPTMDELTVKQFIELSKVEVNIINYLSVTLGINYKEAFNSKAKGIDRLLKRLGTLEDYTKITPPSPFYLDDKIYYTKNIEVSTVGQRHTIEMNAIKLQNEELLCFVLAIGIVDDPMDINKVNALKDKLLNEPYKKILPTAFFLASRFLIGRNGAMNYLRRLRQVTNMRLREIKLKLTA